MPEMKGYLMAACVSHEMKRLLKNSNTHDVAMGATKIMQRAASCLKLPHAKYCGTLIEDGFLSFGAQDGSGSYFGTDYRDKSDFNEKTGYRMTSDNIDDPGLQLVFLSGLAAVIQWGEQQTQTS
ncbi:MAG: hypothetical protein WA082_03480 [Candidatus Moraniibacteriota bacterium]